MKDLTVLISASGSPSIPGIIACFKNNGERKIRVVGVDMSDEPSARYMVDAFYQVPAATHPDYCNILLDICKKEHVDIYFPGVSAEVSALVKRWDDFKRIGVTLSVSNSNSVDVANNKLKTYQMLAEAGIPVPEYYPVHTVNDFVEGCKYMGYPQKPVCLKIVNGSGSRGVRIIDANKSRYQLFAHEKPNSFYTSYDDMLSILKEVDVLDELMLVEFMPGNEYTVDLLAHKGTVIYQVGRENVVSIMSIAQESVLAYDRQAYKICSDVVRLMHMDGNVGFDFMRSADGTAVLMDINPRLTATVSVIAAGGVNLPYLRIKQLLGEPLPHVSPQFGTRMKRRYLEYFTNSEGELIKF